MKANGIQTVLDEDDTEYVLTWISEEVPEEVSEERKKRLRLLHSYENGRIKEAAPKGGTQCYYKNTPNRYNWNNYKRSLVFRHEGDLQFLAHQNAASWNTADPLFYEEGGVPPHVPTKRYV